MLSIFNAYVFSHISIISKIKVKNDLSFIDVSSGIILRRSVIRTCLKLRITY